MPEVRLKDELSEDRKVGSVVQLLEVPAVQGAVSQENWEKESSRAAAAETGQEETPEVEPSKERGAYQVPGRDRPRPRRHKATAVTG